MTTLDDRDLFDAPDGPRPGAAPARKCRHPRRARFAVPQSPRYEADGGEIAAATCSLCGHNFYRGASRRSRNNRKRGNGDELVVARILGGVKVGQLNLPWDVTIPGYIRVQCKQLDRWPSVAKVVEWLDAIPAGHELRAVTLADTPGPGGGKTRRLIVLDLESFASWHGGDREQRHEG